MLHFYLVQLLTNVYEKCFQHLSLFGYNFFFITVYFFIMIFKNVVFVFLIKLEFCIYSACTFQTQFPKSLYYLNAPSFGKPWHDITIILDSITRQVKLLSNLLERVMLSNLLPMGNTILWLIFLLFSYGFVCLLTASFSTLYFCKASFDFR